MIDALKAHLRREEGVKLTPYRDTVGKLTIGVGCNLDAGLYPEEVDFILDNRVKKCIADLKQESYWENLSDTQKIAVCAMRFQLGLNGFLKFQKMRSALGERRYNDAEKEALNSEWAKQVPARAQRVAEMLRGEGWKI